MSFFGVKTDALKDWWSPPSQSFTTLTVFFSRSGLIPSIFTDLSNMVNLCVVLAFSPKLQLTVLFNFPVLILQMLLTCPFSYLGYVPFQSISLSDVFLYEQVGWFQVVLRNILPGTVLPCCLKLSATCHVTYFFTHEKEGPLHKSWWRKFEFAEIGLFCTLGRNVRAFQQKEVYRLAWAAIK